MGFLRDRPELLSQGAYTGTKGYEGGTLGVLWALSAEYPAMPRALNGQLSAAAQRRTQLILSGLLRFWGVRWGSQGPTHARAHTRARSLSCMGDRYLRTRSSSRTHAHTPACTHRTHFGTFICARVSEHACLCERAFFVGSCISIDLHFCACVCSTCVCSKRVCACPGAVRALSCKGGDLRY